MERTVPTVDEAIAILIDRARKTVEHINERGGVSGDPPPWGDTHCHLSPSVVARDHYHWEEDPGTAEPASCKAEPVFLEAAWELCFRGILRPGVWHQPAAEVGYGAGRGYCITPFGREWLRSPSKSFGVPATASEFSALLSGNQTLGESFTNLASEAYNCFRFGCFVACIAVTEAAKEAVATMMRGTTLDNERRAQMERFAKPLPNWRTGDISRGDAFASLLNLEEFAHFAQDSVEATAAPPGMAVVSS